MSADGSVLEFEPFKPGPTAQLPALYHELRERFPVYQSASNIWVISRFDDVKAVQSNPAVFSSRPNPYEGDSAPSDAEMTPETIERLMPRVDADVAAELLTAVTRIYEASAFQDITGQRISKIIGAVLDIETKIGTLVQACGTSMDGLLEPQGDAALLNGPQLGKNAATQDDIDALFESL